MHTVRVIQPLPAVQRRPAAALGPHWTKLFTDEARHTRLDFQVGPAIEKFPQAPGSGGLGAREIPARLLGRNGLRPFHNPLEERSSKVDIRLEKLW